MLVFCQGKGQVTQAGSQTRIYSAKATRGGAVLTGLKSEGVWFSLKQA